MHCKLLHAIVLNWSCKPLIASQAVASLSANASHCTARCFKLSRSHRGSRRLLLQATPSIALQPFASYCGLCGFARYCTASHCSCCKLVRCKLLQVIAASASYSKLWPAIAMQTTASYCGYCKPLHCKLFHAFADMTTYCIVSCPKLFLILQTIACCCIILRSIASYANYCKLLQAIAAITSNCQLLYTMASCCDYCKPRPAIAYYLKKYELLQAIAKLL